MANSVFVVTPPNGYTVFPGGVSQVPIYPNQSQVHVIHGNPPSVSQQPIERTLKEGKALGAIQILIGLIHLGLGSVMGTVLVGNYTALSFYGGFPFWGGIWVSNTSHLATKFSESASTLWATLSSCALQVPGQRGRLDGNPAQVLFTKRTTLLGLP